MKDQYVPSWVKPHILDGKEYFNHMSISAKIQCYYCKNTYYVEYLRLVEDPSDKSHIVHSCEKCKQELDLYDPIYDNER